MNYVNYVKSALNLSLTSRRMLLTTDTDGSEDISNVKDWVCKKHNISCNVTPIIIKSQTWPEKVVLCNGDRNVDSNTDANGVTGKQHIWYLINDHTNTNPEGEVVYLYNAYWNHFMVPDEGRQAWGKGELGVECDGNINDLEAGRFIKSPKGFDFHADAYTLKHKGSGKKIRFKGVRRKKRVQLLNDNQHHTMKFEHTLLPDESWGNEASAAKEWIGSIIKFTYEDVKDYIHSHSPKTMETRVNIPGMIGGKEIELSSLDNLNMMPVANLVVNTNFAGEVEINSKLEKSTKDAPVLIEDVCFWSLRFNNIVTIKGKSSPVRYWTRTDVYEHQQMLAEYVKADQKRKFKEFFQLKCDERPRQTALFVAE